MRYQFLFTWMTNRDVQVLARPCHLISSPHEPRRHPELSAQFQALCCNTQGAAWTLETQQGQLPTCYHIFLYLCCQKMTSWFFSKSKTAFVESQPMEGLEKEGPKERRQQDSLREGAGAAHAPPSDSCQQRYQRTAKISIKRLLRPFCLGILNTQIDILIRIRGKPLKRGSFPEIKKVWDFYRERHA